jgi:SAM-dependent methyltransferase
MEEKEKYTDIYTQDKGIGLSYRNRHGHAYGGGLWGEGIVDFLKKKNIKSLVDIGCGQGRFVNLMRFFIPTVYGVDIASVKTGNTIKNELITYLDGEAKSIPLPDKSVECLTSFDCLEHCLEEDIDNIIKEFDRVATKYYAFSISHEHDSHDGVSFHMTVQPPGWWFDKFEKLGKIDLIGKVPNLPFYQPYIFIEK